MEDVAREVGVTKGALYRYFKSKTEVLSALQEQMRANADERFRMLDNPEDVRKGFSAVLAGLLEADNIPQIALGYELLAEANHDDGLRELLRNNLTDDFRRLREIAVRFKKAGRIRSNVDPDVLAFVWMSLSFCARRRYFMGFDRRGTLREYQRALELVMQSAGAA